MLTKALSLQRRLFPLFNRCQTLLLSPFCSKASRVWSQTAQKAVFATAIINQILNVKYPSKFTDESLREKIIGLKINNENFTMNQEYRRQMLQMFTTGIPLSPRVFTQQRVQDAKNKKLFIFCPNYVVTKQIFQQFMRDYRSQVNRNVLITGNYGISKTISIILLIQLSNYIQKLIYQAENNPIKQAELKELRSLKLLMDNIPKVLYWSINMKRLQTELFQLILEQFPQLSKQHKLELQQKKDYKKLIKSLKKIYPKTVYKILVIDQINSLAAQVKSWNTYFQWYKQKKSKLTSKQQIKNLKKQALNEWQRKGTNNIQLALDNIRSLRLLSNRFFLNSSTNIELDILQKDTDGGVLKKKRLSLHHQDKKIQIETLEYQNLLKNQLWAKIDFWNCFWFQFTRRFIQRPQLFARLQTLKPKIIERFLQNSKEGNAFEFQIKPFYRFLQCKIMPSAELRSTCLCASSRSSRGRGRPSSTVAHCNSQTGRGTNRLLYGGDSRRRSRIRFGRFFAATNQIGMFLPKGGLLSRLRLVTHAFALWGVLRSSCFIVTTVRDFNLTEVSKFTAERLFGLLLCAQQHQQQYRNGCAEARLYFGQGDNDVVDQRIAAAMSLSMEGYARDSMRVCHRRGSRERFSRYGVFDLGVEKDHSWGLSDGNVDAVQQFGCPASRRGDRLFTLALSAEAKRRCCASARRKANRDVGMRSVAKGDSGAPP